MTRFPIALAAAALLCGTAAGAQMKPAPKPTAKPTPAKIMAAKPAPAMAAKPAIAAPKPVPRAKPAAAPGGRMVSAKLANGKTVTYNCALAGNKTKKACQ
ncbi:hypothetical protein [Sphingomonas sp.]|uniref:hypothetical protein n=1 Tax=Sphingomonas sp. TaxID=28214 RepID=UPI003341B8C6